MFPPARTFLVCALLSAGLVAPNMSSLSPMITQAAAVVSPCDIAFPNSQGLRVLSVSSGPGTVISWGGKGYVFDLAERNFNAEVKQVLHVTVPAGDTVASFDLTSPKEHRIYTGLAHVFRQGGQQHVCLHGTAFINLGNGDRAKTAAAVIVRLDGTIGKTTARVDMLLGRTPYFVNGYPHVRG